MKYKDEVPKKKQIRMNEFPFLPGDRVLMKYHNAYYDGTVNEVWSANPEYVLGGPTAKDAGKISWKKPQRNECRRFLRDGHMPVRIRLKKSMGVVIRLSKNENGKRLTRPIYIRLCTYDILDRKEKREIIFYLNPLP